MHRFALVFASALTSLALGSAFDSRERAPQDEKDAKSAVQDPHFRNSQRCSLCHSNAPNATAMRDEDDRPIAPYDLWRASMMANSARDPFWRAAVSAEVSATPSRKTEIEAKCMRCHAPMYTYGKKPEEISSAVLDADPESAAHIGLAQDGVSCTVCHRMAKEGLGDKETFSGKFRLDDQGRIFGPHAEPFFRPMKVHTGLTATHGPHVTKSAACASCHTLFTHTLDPDGNATGSVYAEQTPYLEWQNSAFNDEVEKPGPDAASCQACHMSKQSVDGVDLETRIARNPAGRDFPFVTPRSHFSRHIFVGGNTLIPAILRDNAMGLRIDVPPAAFDATIAATREQLSKRTADLAILGTRVGDGKLAFTVALTNKTGHKFPSAYPSRRAWLRIRVFDAQGKRIFASGEFDNDGRLVDESGKPLASEGLGGSIEPHRDVITSTDAVQVYEVVMADEQGNATYRLMRAAKNLKDNRLLPKGWSAAHPDARHTAPVGTDGDDSFGPAHDEVTYRIDIANRKGPYRVEATLLYQTLGARYAAELFAYDTPDIRAFRQMYDAAKKTPEVVATATTRSE